jgi:signal transduction histidine kinase
MIAQEALTNALKHSQATQISIHLSSASSVLTLRLSDNGKGFDPNIETHSKPGHFGCMGVRERCLKMNAQIDWQSSPHQGTEVTITLPLVP